MATVSIYPKIEQMSIPTEKMDITISTEKKELEEMDVKNQEKEIKEIIDIINEAIVHLDKALKKIDNATNWGLHDTICGGRGYFSSMIKYDNMEEANHDIRLANKSVDKLKEKIKDIENIESINVSEHLSFMDVFFDNIISDMRVQHKIAEAERNCKKARRQLDDLRKKLKERLEPKTISEMQAEKKTKEEEEKDIKAAFEATNKAIECLKENIRPLEKAADIVGDEGLLCCCGFIGYMIIEGKVDDAKFSLRKSVRVLDDLTKKLKNANIDTTNRSEYLKFIDMSKDIISCRNTSFDRNACNEFQKAKSSCLISICEIESIKDELKEILVKKNIQF